MRNCAVLVSEMCLLQTYDVLRRIPMACAHRMQLASCFVEVLKSCLVLCSENDWASTYLFADLSSEIIVPSELSLSAYSFHIPPNLTQS